MDHKKVVEMVNAVLDELDSRGLFDIGELEYAMKQEVRRALAIRIHNVINSP